MQIIFKNLYNTVRKKTFLDVNSDILISLQVLHLHLWK